MLIRTWHSWLDMPKYDEAWHRNDIAGELGEFREATGVIHKWSELSDVVYTYTRARWSGHAKLKYPLAKSSLPVGVLYMFPKYTSRWLFYRRAGKKLKPTTRVAAVLNPKKPQKVRRVAVIHGLDPEQYLIVCQQQRRWWPLLK